MKNSLPHIISFNKIGGIEQGYISIAEFNKNAPFAIQRVYWTYQTPEDIKRGHHAHKKLHQIIIAVSGTIEMCLEDRQGKTFQFKLTEPSSGIYIPPGYWRTIEFKNNAVLLCLASDLYDETEYIRDYKQFKNSKID